MKQIYEMDQLLEGPNKVVFGDPRKWCDEAEWELRSELTKKKKKNSQMTNNTKSLTQTD